MNVKKIRYKEKKIKPKMNRIKVLILDDEEGIRQEIGEFLRETGFTVHEAEDPGSAFEILQNHPIDIAILDIRLPQMSGLQVLSEFKKISPHMEVIMISGHGDMDSVIQALRNGACDYLKKPFHLEDLQVSIQKTKRYVTIHNLLVQKRESFTKDLPEIWKKVGTPFIFGSSVMEKLYDDMLRVAVADSTTVLISGESGTGKEIVARGIHLFSSRKEKAFVTVNCSSVPDELFESEFFGYKKGAFTGANQDKPGWFEAANHGTLFLDEIGDMKLSLQAKLLRVMDDQQVNRLGTTNLIKVDVRVVAATNHNLAKMVAEKRFRQDLYHRLNAFTIQIPPLRERRDDIPLLLDYFIKYYCEKLDKSVTRVQKSLMKALDHYDFPGNVRELRHMVERAVILCDGPELTLDHFDHLLDKLKESGHYSVAPGNPIGIDIQQYEREAIEKALRECSHNKSRAARMLGLSRQALDRRMEKFGIK